MSAESSDPTNRPRISEDDAHRLLARAAELDARAGDTLSLAQLREIAAEAGIAAEAFEAALREYDAQNLNTSAPADARHVARRAKHRQLLERLSRHRALAVFAIVFGVACATPGDLVFLTLVVSAPLYGLYELAIAITRSRTKPPALPPVSPKDRGDGSTGCTPRSAPADRMMRHLLLRTV